MGKIGLNKFFLASIAAGIYVCGVAIYLLDDLNIVEMLSTIDDTEISCVDESTDYNYDAADDNATTTIVSESGSNAPSSVYMFPFQLNCFGVKASVCGVKRTFLVDTGCSYSMINKETYETLKKQGKMDGVKLHNEELQMADNGITTMPWFYATFTIGGTTVEKAKCFIINDRTAKNILGMTALKGSKIDFSTNTITFS